MKKNVIKIIALAGLMVSGAASAQNTGSALGNFETKATIENACLLDAKEINFGILSGPINIKTASSNMSVKCTNKTQYTIDLAYGGIYGEGPKVDENKYDLIVVKETGSYGTYRISKNGNSASSTADFECRSDGRVFFYNKSVAVLYGTERTGSWLTDNYSACNGNRANSSKVGTLGNNPAFEYGLLNGGTSGDSLAYEILLPDESNKVWNKGVNSYVALATGGIQVIPLNARVRNVGKENSAPKYVAQDSFLDTITVTIAY